MARPIGVASELLSLVVSSLESSTSLYQTIKGLNSRQKSVRELRDEVKALTTILLSLNHAILESRFDFTALKLPLVRCSNACENVEAFILKSSESEGEMRADFRSWAQTTYREGNITVFKSMVEVYKSTITVALCGADLRTSSITSKILNKYQEKIDETQSDLEDNLERIDGELQRLTMQDFDNEPDEMKRRLQDEKECILKCRDICTEVASHIETVRPQIPQSSSAVYVDDTASILADKAVTRDTEQATGRCKDPSGVLPQLTRSLEEVAHRQQILQRRPASPNQHTQQQKLHAEIESIKQSIEMGTEVSKQVRSERTNVFEDITIADDGHQVIVSTCGDLVLAKNISAGARSRQWLGQMSDESLQRLSQARYQVD